MIILPLFGKDSSPHRTSFVISLIASFVLWIVFSISAVFIKIEPKTPQYKTVQIVLDSTPEAEPESEMAELIQQNEENIVLEEVQENIQEEFHETFHNEVLPENTNVIENQTVSEIPVEDSVISPAKKAEIPKNDVPVVEKPVVDKILETASLEEKIVEKKVETQTENPPAEKLDTKPAEIADDFSTADSTVVEQKMEKEAEKKYVQQQIYKSPEELLKEQLEHKTKPKEVDWDSMFADETDSTDEKPKEVQKVQSQTQLEGSAATTTTTDTTKTSVSENSQNVNKEVSSGTQKALENIQEVEYKSVSNGIESKSTIQTTNNSSNHVAIKMENGSSRRLMIPSKPEIELSKQAAESLSGDMAERTVDISFKIQAEGKVLQSSIEITPRSMLTELVINEITAQIGEWFFEKSDSEGKCSFKYTIKVR